ncbi:UNVERIFIED_ORG: hypothetical protein J2W74_000070 [Methylorubrum zatmanii]|jgi:hypothetical protein|uniref:Uncharacterized protein n=1 Tax=Methylorubrum extorquens TaxID=408 RepID=A0A1S1NIC8_METEX|nr:hypothetical protein BK022_27760 [Methylorubrum extorquens]
MQKQAAIYVCVQFKSQPLRSQKPTYFHTYDATSFGALSLATPDHAEIEASGLILHQDQPG